MSSKVAKNQESMSYQALLDKVHSLQEEVHNLEARLEEAEELRRAISEGDLDALVISGLEGEMVFTLDSADQAYRILVETMNEGTATLACDGTILYCNRRFAELLRISISSIVGTSIYQFIEPADKTTFKTLLKKEKGRGELNMRIEESTRLPVYLSVSSLQVAGSQSAWCLVVTDLTEQKKNEEILANIEIARKKEIHHRIKNNLQVISSLLDLQAEKLSSKECIENSVVLKAFKESQDRVMSMALIHEELYEGGEIDKLKFSAYLKKLVENLFQIYSLENSNISLSMSIEENIFLNMDTAVPLGIIVNELITNSLKYAFTEDKKGEIQVQLCREEKNNDTSKSLFSLIVSDNGKGIPENIDIEGLDSLGMQLVITLVDQLDGEIELKREQGTEFRITFEVEEKCNPE